MADSERRTTISLREQFEAEPFRFEFFQAVRLLLHPQWEPSRGDRGRRQRPALGEEGHLTPPRIRFGAVPSLAFPAGEIAGFADTRPENSEATTWPRMLVPFLGLTGPAGVLPYHYTRLLMERGQARSQDFALRDFLDIFNQRAVSLFFRAQAKSSLVWQYERYRREPGAREELFTLLLRCLVGLGTKYLPQRLSVADETILFFAGHFAHYPRPAVSLEQMLCDFLSLPVHVIQFVGRWLNLSQPDRSRLPAAGSRRGQNCQLGRSLVVGTRVWEIQTLFRIRVGPMNYDQFRSFLPGSPGLKRLSDLVRLSIPPQLEYEVQLVLDRAEVPPACLTSDRRVTPRLGWDCWLKQGDLAGDTDHAVFSSLSYRR